MTEMRHMQDGTPSMWAMRFLKRHRDHWLSSESRSATILSVVLFVASMAFNYVAESFATKRASNPVDDIVLSHIPPYDLEWIFIWGVAALALFAISLLIANPKRIPFMLHSLTLFYFIRALFISMTHLGNPLPIPPDAGIIVSRLFFGGGLFFSGHVGAPFLMSLIFWKNAKLRNIFIVFSLLFAATALLGHYHYTIDVVSAYFITYSIFHIAKAIFPREHALFEAEPLKKEEGLQA